MLIVVMPEHVCRVPFQIFEGQTVVQHGLCLHGSVDSDGVADRLCAYDLVSKVLAEDDSLKARINPRLCPFFREEE